VHAFRVPTLKRAEADTCATLCPRKIGEEGPWRGLQREHGDLQRRKSHARSRHETTGNILASISLHSPPFCLYTHPLPSIPSLYLQAHSLQQVGALAKARFVFDLFDRSAPPPDHPSVTNQPPPCLVVGLAHSEESKNAVKMSLKCR